MCSGSEEVELALMRERRRGRVDHVSTIFETRKFAMRA